jgi:hypothetical protein
MTTDAGYPCNLSAELGKCLDCGTNTFCGRPHGSGHDHSRSAQMCTEKTLADDHGQPLGDGAFGVGP